MNKETLNIIFTIIFLTIILGIIIFLMYDNFNTFKKKLKNNEYDLDLKKECEISKKEIEDNRNRVYSFYKNHGLNITIDNSNIGLNPYDSKTVTINEYKEKKKVFKKRNKKLNIILNSTFFGIGLILLIFGIYANVSHNLISFSNTSYVTIKTSSMEHKNEKNTYLNEYSLNNQIKTFSFIGLDKIQNKDDIKLYDVCGYVDKKSNKLIIHRIIKIENREDGRYFTFRGDSNEISDYYLIKDSDVLYKYNGYSNYSLGLFLSYINSITGMVVIVYILISLLVLDLLYKKKEKLYDLTLKESISRFNEEEITNLGTVKYIEIK